MDVSTRKSRGVPTFDERYFKKTSLKAWNSASYTNINDAFIGLGQCITFSSHWFFKEHFAPYLRFGFSNGVGEYLNHVFI
ncbi:hypothetical protein [Flammeovirga pacifica]|uniref:Uncharacterized protein n=1 Tax=Flammeovirga pacifica TaxID=915059 RepID=A0A1S1YTZ8_FLAPC|nr:hypothetical protein [Flammeovirga pacifica]OHX64500.1 hypothetical protein NH26_23260 [Flammeovirga pacifica]